MKSVVGPTLPRASNTKDECQLLSNVTTEYLDLTESKLRGSPEFRDFCLSFITARVVEVGWVCR